MSPSMLHRFITLGRIMTAGTRNFFRNAWLSIASTAIMTVTLSAILIAVILNLALNDTLDEVTKKIDISIFFNDSAPVDKIKQLQVELEQLDNVTSTSYIDKAEALRRYREQNQDNPELLEAVTSAENPLPRSVEIMVKDLNNVDPIIQVTQKEEYLPMVQDTSYGEDRQRTIQRIGTFKSFLNKAGVVTSVTFATIAVLIIFNTIRMAIFSRRDEIEIMRLVGATNGYIRGPLVFEAMLNGVIAAILSLTVAYIILFIGGPKIISYVNFTDTLNFFEDWWTLTALATIATGMFIGALSSMLAMIRYLKL